MASSKPVIILDMDGCMASQGKIWFEKEEDKTYLDVENGEAYLHRGGLGVYKTISDHDSWAIDQVKKHAHIAIFSGDTRVNRAWAERRGVPFIFTAGGKAHGDKWSILKPWLEEKYGEVPDYYYLGDAMPDAKCMSKAKQAFMPADACKVLKRMNKNLSWGFVELETNSGCGVFEEMALRLVDLEVIRPEVLGGYDFED